MSSWISSNMFRVVALRQSAEAPDRRSEGANIYEGVPVEEIPEKGRRPRSIPSKEWMIVVLFYLLVTTAMLSLLFYFVANIKGFAGTEEAVKVFWYSLSSLVGYFLGANKEV